MRDKSISAEELADYRRRHFYKRVHERIGKHIDAHALYQEIQEAMERADDRVRFKCRTLKKGSNVYRVQIDGEEWLIIADQRENRPITVVPRTDPLYRPGYSAKFAMGGMRRTKFKPSGRREARRGRA